jgi:predicted nucleotidyltransferase
MQLVGAFADFHGIPSLKIGLLCLGRTCILHGYIWECIASGSCNQTNIVGLFLIRVKEDFLVTAFTDEIPAEYRGDISRAVEISKAEGCREVYVFGSVTVGTAGPRSDIDIAVRGCPPERFYRLLGRLMEELSHSVDLIDLDIEKNVAEFLEEEGQLVHVG